jgi:hypothetical protein
MTIFGRVFRKLFYAGLFLFFVALFVYFVFKIYYPTLPNCFDGIKNQTEEGVDCGGMCDAKCPPLPPPANTKPIEVAWARVFYSDVGTYDLAARISNPNTTWGIAEFRYAFIARDSSGAAVIEQSGTSYLLPDSYDYLIIPSVKSDKNPVTAELNIEKGGQKWQEVSSVYNNLSQSFPFSEIRYSSSDANGFPTASAILQNATTYDFNKINIKVVLYDKNEEPVAVNVSDQRTMRSGEERLFRLFWTAAPKNEVFSQDFKAVTNIFDPQNFMSRSGANDRNR